MVDQHPSARTRLPIDEAQSMPHDVGQSAHDRSMLAPYHQPLGAARAADQFVDPGFEQGFEGLGEHRCGAAQKRHVKAGDQALAIVQGPQTVHAALKANVQVQIGGIGRVLLKHGKRNVVAGAHGEQLMALVPRVGEHPSEVGAQRFDVRLHARACATFGPQQSLGKLRRPRPLALRPDDQRLAQCFLPLPQRTPDIPV